MAMLNNQMVIDHVRIMYVYACFTWQWLSNVSRGFFPPPHHPEPGGPAAQVHHPEQKKVEFTSKSSRNSPTKWSLKEGDHYPDKKMDGPHYCRGKGNCHIFRHVRLMLENNTKGPKNYSLCRNILKQQFGP